VIEAHFISSRSLSNTAQICLSTQRFSLLSLFDLPCRNSPRDRSPHVIFPLPPLVERDFQVLDLVLVLYPPGSSLSLSDVMVLSSEPFSLRGFTSRGAFLTFVRWEKVPRRIPQPFAYFSFSFDPTDSSTSSPIVSRKSFLRKVNLSLPYRIRAIRNPWYCSSNICVSLDIVLITGVKFLVFYRGPPFVMWLVSNRDPFFLGPFNYRPLYSQRSI